MTDRNPTIEEQALAAVLYQRHAVDDLADIAEQAYREDTTGATPAEVTQAVKRAFITGVLLQLTHGDDYSSLLLLDKSTDPRWTELVDTIIDLAENDTTTPQTGTTT